MKQKDIGQESDLSIACNNSALSKFEGSWFIRVGKTWQFVVEIICLSHFCVILTLCWNMLYAWILWIRKFYFIIQKVYLFLVQIDRESNILLSCLMSTWAPVALTICQFSPSKFLNEIHLLIMQDIST